jgi:ELWxxDGT repeat protein
MDLVAGTGGAFPRAMTPFGSSVLLSGVVGNTSQEPLITDGTTAGTTLLRDIVRAFDDSSPRDFTEVGARVYFAAGSPGRGDEPWWTDGTRTGTTIIADVQPGSFGSRPASPAALGPTQVVYAADLFAGGWQLFVSDAATNLTSQLTNAVPEPLPRGMTSLGALALFAADSANGREPWVTDGTPAGTHELRDLRPGSANSIPLLTEEFAATSSLVYFSADDGVHGDELWRTDGTSLGTVMVGDLRPGSAGSAPERLTPDGNRLWFTAIHATAGRELWLTDGTATGTTMIELAPGPAASFPEQLVVAGSRLYFTALVAGRREIWSTDGTAIGTSRAVSAQHLAQSFTDLTWSQGGLFFLTDDATGFGRELWFTDGSVLGTNRLTDVGPGPMHGPIPGSLIARSGGAPLLFAAHDLSHGLQLWTSDGTAAGTQRLSNFGTSGFGAASFTNFRAIGNRVFFGCNDGITGLEPWVYDPNSGGSAFVVSYGVACRGSTGDPRIGASGLPQIGSATFAVTLVNALPLAPATQLFSFLPSNLSISGCRLNLAIPLLTGVSLSSDTNGFATAPLVIPNSPTYVGIDLFSQWVILDPAGGIYQAIAGTDGLQIHLGF